jgi:hypothetical protein
MGHGLVCNNYNSVSVTVLYGSPLFLLLGNTTNALLKFLQTQMSLCLPYGIKVYLRCHRLQFLMHSSPLTASCSTIFAIPMARNWRGFAKQGRLAAESLTSIWGSLTPLLLLSLLLFDMIQSNSSFDLRSAYAYETCGATRTLLDKVHSVWHQHYGKYSSPAFLQPVSLSFTLLQYFMESN